MKARIYYFTGTGNSMRAARVIAQAMGDTEIISMRVNPEEYPATDCDVVGFVYPVYHWTMPAPVAAFVEKLEINPQAYVFVVTMPSFICGIACERLAEILAKKGAQISYGNIVHSVANYVIVYPPFPSAKLRVPATERKLKRIAADICQRKEKAYPRASAFIRCSRERVMTCISCGLCSRVCPCHNIVLENGRPTFQHHCANCMACVVSCPKRAIGYEIKGEDRKLLEASSRKTPLVRLMRLPEKRKLYMNPYITAKDLTKEKE